MKEITSKGYARKCNREASPGKIWYPDEELTFSKLPKDKTLGVKSNISKNTFGFQTKMELYFGKGDINHSTVV